MYKMTAEVPLRSLAENEDLETLISWENKKYI